MLQCRAADACGAIVIAATEPHERSASRTSNFDREVAAVRAAAATRIVMPQARRDHGSVICHHTTVLYTVVWGSPCISLVVARTSYRIVFANFDTSMVTMHLKNYYIVLFRCSNRNIPIVDS